MATRSERLWVMEQLGRVGGIVYETPVGKTVILKSVYGYTQGAVTGELELLLRSPAGHAVYLMRLALTEDKSVFAWEGWAVLEAGDQVQLLSPGVVIQSWGSGASLPAP